MLTLYLSVNNGEIIPQYNAKYGSSFLPAGVVMHKSPNIEAKRKHKYLYKVRQKIPLPQKICDII